MAAVALMAVLTIQVAAAFTQLAAMVVTALFVLSGPVIPVVSRLLAQAIFN
jgi:hypothetical protein